jgi:glyoxylase-like metal-dependent hydrolase (beta-lactamase superfamily II)
MMVLPFVHEGLGNSSYLVEVGDGNALLVDPDRSFDRYLRAAEERHWRIAGVLETHVHADFVTGAVEAIRATGATVFQPEDAGCHYPHQAARPNEAFAVDNVQIEPIASPGHTPEHMSYVLRRASGPPVLFSGGSIIVGGAARTDLIAPERTEELTRDQHRTLRRAFASLPDETLLYPTHGGGSFCSAGAGGGERWSTLGRERADNPALSIEDEEEFVRWFPSTFPAAPDYFFRMRAFNQAGPRLRHDIALPPALSPNAFERRMKDGLIIDTRSVESYSAAHVQNSLHIELRDSFAVWLGWVVAAETPLLFVVDPASLEDVIREALLVGYEKFSGWLDGGIDAWLESGRPVSSTEYVEGEAARSAIAEGADVLDVREDNEFAAGHARNAIHIPLGNLINRPLGGNEDAPVVVYCGHGERASTAASLLERAGRTRIVNVRGGLDALEADGRSGRMS